ncbi:MAG: hypothetical protein A2734_02795 [Parcubacteria group bacterium RIFCSPHIGHO2_01_FULL_40_30]|nr:MAG: hypothetical protein A2734_02795 [Parcubacteria group bacterium RIFCSPHIGHO2_01_FULL_40_30]OHB23577.1 MAG: hypothetical protein A3I22_02935 [Parcubacteria group bacterium RIFCSPLOWO2_02_FULL_40_12]
MGFLDAKFTRLVELLPVFAANYAKRFMEHVYDNVFQTPFGQKLVAMGKSKKYAVEFGLNLLTAFFEDRLAENTKLKKFVKEVGIDVVPEISKRMINGAREEILGSAKTLEEKEIVQILFGLEDKELFGLLGWFYEKSASELMAISSQLSLMSAEQIARLMNFSVEDREKYFGVLNPRSRPKEAKQEILKAMTDDIKGLRQRFQR